MNKLKKNIAILCPCLTNGGAERAVSNLSRRLSGSANIYLILFYNRKITYDYSGTLIQLHFDEKYSKYKKCFLGKLIAKFAYFTVIKEIKSIKKDYKIDACVSFLDLLNIYNLISQTGEEVYVSVRNNRSMQNITKLDKAINICAKLFYKKATKVVSLSYGVTDDLVKNFGIPNNKIETIYNHFDIAGMSAKAEKALPESVKKIIEGKRVILSMGRFEEQKQFLNLINICAPILSDYDDLILVIVGRGTLRNDMLNLINEKDLHDKVVLLDYMQNPMPLIKQSEIFVMNSKYEGLCNSIVEAMVCGTLTVSRDCKYGPREMIAGITEYESVLNSFQIYDRGLLVPMNNDVEMEKAIRYSLLHRTELKQLSINAKNYFSEEFNTHVDQCWKTLLKLDE